MQLKGTLKGHNGWVTQIATNARYPNMIISSSRGRNFCQNSKLLCEYYLLCLCISYRRLLKILSNRQNRKG